MEPREDIDGIIHSIVVENFFCHERYQIEFNKNVNFVIGRNGSGKSAFVTALAVGFGGKATITNRGNNLTCFIKKGAESASVEIKLKNSGPSAYKHDVYGDSITILRTISKAGSSAYKVKSHTGQVISTTVGEVRNIALCHNIQVDNPIAVLNQDEARSFQNNDDEKKYAFFRKATNFDDTEKNYERTLNLCKNAKNVQERKKQAFSDMDKEYREWKELSERLQSQDEMEQQKKALENEYYWSQVAELERAEAECQQHVRAREHTCAELQRRLDALDEGGDDRALQGLRAELAAKEAARAEAAARLEAAAAARREREAGARRAAHRAARMRDDLARERRKRDDLRAGIANIEADASGAGGARAELRARAARCEEAAEAARARLATQEHAAAQARDHAAAARDLAEAAADRLRDAEHKLEQAKQQLRSLEAHSGNSLAAFGAQMVELAARVRQAAQQGAFSAPPRGPVGAYIKLQDKKWGSALEHIIGRASMKTYCVNNDKDAKVLLKIIGEVYPGRGGDKPVVVVSEFLARVHDVSRRAVRHPRHVTALDALRVDDPVVANFLIDNCSPESVLLVPDQDSAASLTSSVERVPRGLRRVVTQECAEYLPAPQYRSYGGRAKPVRFLHQDLADRVRQVRAECAAAERAAAEARAQLAASTAQRHEAEERVRGEGRALRALQAAARGADAELAAARDALADHHAPTVQVLEAELKESEACLEKLEAELQSIEQQESVDGDMSETTAPVAELNAALQRLKDECTALSQAVEQQQVSQERAGAARAALAARLEAARRDVAQGRERLAAARARLAEELAGASDLCPRIDNPRPKESVLRLLQQARAALAQHSGTALSRAEVGEKLLGARRRRAATKRALDRVASLIDQIETTAQQHLQTCYRTQTDIIREVQVSFVCILDMARFKGRLEIDAARRRLRMSCSRDGRGPGAAAQSGGERSYATVAFFMALWDCIELPFVFLDEFDVFMDNVNRKVVMELLVSHALKKHPDRQYVFLTPQDGSSLERNERVSIFKLQSPRE